MVDVFCDPMIKQETDPEKLRAICLNQPRVSAEQMDAQIRAGIAWSRKILQQTGGSATGTGGQTGATKEAEGEG